jgi:transcriptional regulator GlxA family with amidase domain
LVSTAKNWIDRNLEQQLSLAVISQQVACSPHHLVRVFSKHLGIAPAAYILKQRMQLAATILSTTSEPIKAIAARLHYSDAFAFSHAFSKAMSLSPSQWRQQHGGH